MLKLMFSEQTDMNCYIIKKVHKFLRMSKIFKIIKKLHFVLKKKSKITNKRKIITQRLFQILDFVLYNLNISRCIEFMCKT